jgi:hypothetical protein
LTKVRTALSREADQPKVNICKTLWLYIHPSHRSGLIAMNTYFLFNFYSATYKISSKKMLLISSRL